MMQKDSSFCAIAFVYFVAFLSCVYVKRVYHLFSKN